MTLPSDIVVSEEEEWREVQQRFIKEGLDYPLLCIEKRLLHVWRWLVDAESNLSSCRKQIEKLREQQSEDMEEMECYMGHIKELADKRADHLESETMCLRSRLETSQHQTNTLATLLEKSGLEGIADASLGEQVAFLIADRSKLMEEIAILNKLNGINGLGKESDLISEIIKVSSEKEILRYEAVEQKERVVQLEKHQKQTEMDNERLAFKLSEALAELEEREAQLMQIGRANGGNRGGMQSSVSMVWPVGGGRRESPSPPPGRRRQSAGDTLDNDGGSHYHYSYCHQHSRAPSDDTLDRLDAHHHNDAAIYTGSLPRSLSGADYLRSHSYGADSTPPSLMLSEPLEGGSREVRRLQADAETLKSQLAIAIEKYNNLALRHIQMKARRKAQVTDLKARLDLEASALHVQLVSSQSQLTNQKLMLRGEEALRKRIETDYRKALEDKRSLVVNLMGTENNLREKERELIIAQKKINILEKSHAELLSRVLEGRYAQNSLRNQPSRSKSLSRMDQAIFTDLGPV